MEIRYIYLKKETGNRLQRTFTLEEIKAGEDDAHLKTIPGYEVEDILDPLCAEAAGVATEMAKVLKDWHAEDAKKEPATSETKKFVGTWAFRIFRIVSGTHGQPFHFRMWDVIKELEGWRKAVCEITSDLYIWSMEK